MSVENPWSGHFKEHRLVQEMIEDKAGMIALYQSEIDKGFESLEEIEYAMDNKELAEVEWLNANYLSRLQYICDLEAICSNLK